MKATITTLLLTVAMLATMTEPTAAASLGEWIDVMFWSKGLAAVCVLAVFLMWTPTPKSVRS